MPNLFEIQIMQKQLLFDLLNLELTNKGKEVSGLDILIRKAKAGMSKEDIAYVTELVNQKA